MFTQQAKLHIFEKGENSLLAPTGTGASRSFETVET